MKIYINYDYVTLFYYNKTTSFSPSEYCYIMLMDHNFDSWGLNISAEQLVPSVIEYYDNLPESYKDSYFLWVSKNNEDEIYEMFLVSTNDVAAMAFIHNKLYVWLNGSKEEIIFEPTVLKNGEAIYDDFIKSFKGDV